MRSGRFHPAVSRLFYRYPSENIFSMASAASRANNTPSPAETPLSLMRSKVPRPPAGRPTLSADQVRKIPPAAYRTGEDALVHHRILVAQPGCVIHVMGDENHRSSAFSLIRQTISRISRCVSGSSPAVGSSRIRISGCIANTPAIAAGASVLRTDRRSERLAKSRKKDPLTAELLYSPQNFLFAETDIFGP